MCINLLKQNRIQTLNHAYNTYTYQLSNIMKPIYSILIVISILAFQSQSLNFQLIGDNPFCMRFQGGNNYTLQYVVSGNEDQDVKCTISQGSTIILEKEDVSQFIYANHYKSQEPIQVCFENTDGQDKQISFDFYAINDPVRNMIDKKDVQLVQNALVQAYKQMDSISRNQQYQIERDVAHKVNLQESEVKIKWAGIIKIVFLLGSALIQLYIMKGFFTNNHPYQPVESM